MADGLFLPDGTFLPFSTAELTTKLATRQNAGVALGKLEVWLNTLPDPDPVLRKRGEDATVLDDLSAERPSDHGHAIPKKPRVQLPGLYAPGGSAGRRHSHPGG